MEATRHCSEREVASSRICRTKGSKALEKAANLALETDRAQSTEVALRKNAQCAHEEKKLQLQHVNDLEMMKEKDRTALQHEEKRMKLHQDNQMAFLKESQTYQVLT